MEVLVKDLIRVLRKLPAPEVGEGDIHLDIYLDNIDYSLVEKKVETVELCVQIVTVRAKEFRKGSSRWAEWVIKM